MRIFLGIFRSRLSTMASKQVGVKIGPSILSSDLSSLADECKRMKTAGCDYLHLDVMDGHFVPNLTFGHPVVATLKPKFKDTFFDMHMMVADPQKWIDEMAATGVEQYTFHIETTEPTNTTAETIRKIKEAGMKVGLGVKPKTPVDIMFPYLEDIDMALIMTVEPGFGGQKFMTDMMPKIEKLRQMYKNLDIEVDGGVSPSTVELCSKAGANMLVSGTAVVRAADPTEAIRSMRNTALSNFPY